MQVTVMGVSMGAAVAFYFATIFKEVKTLISLIGSPSLVEFYKYKQEVYQFEKNDEFEERLKRYKKIDPLINYHLLEGKKILMTGGLKDKIVPLDYAKALSKKIDSTFIEYDLEHEVSPKMMEDVYNFIDSNLS
jgi:enterochelin esterase-like enzyme